MSTTSNSSASANNNNNNNISTGTDISNVNALERAATRSQVVRAMIGRASPSGTAAHNNLAVPLPRSAEAIKNLTQLFDKQKSRKHVGDSKGAPQAAVVAEPSSESSASLKKDSSKPAASSSAPAAPSSATELLTTTAEVQRSAPAPSNGSSVNSNNNGADAPDAPAATNTRPQAAVTSRAGNLTIVSNSRRQPAVVTPIHVQVPPPRNDAECDLLIANAAALAAPGTGNSTSLTSNLRPLDTPCCYWLQIQGTVTRESLIRATVEEVFDDDNGVRTSVTRQRVYIGNNLLAASHSKRPEWCEAANTLTGAGIAHTGSCSIPSSKASAAANRKPHRAAKVMSFRKVAFIALDPAPPAGAKYAVHHSDDFFPPVNDDIISVKKIEVLSAEEAAAFRNKIEPFDLTRTPTGRVLSMFSDMPAALTDEAAVAEGARVGHQVWSQRPRTDADVANAIAQLGSETHRYYKLLPKELHSVFADLCRNAFTYKLDDPIEVKARNIATLLAIPSLHLRHLRGKHAKKRDQHLRAQLAGYVCELVNPPPAVSEPRPALSPMEAASKRASQTMKLVTENRISAANKRLQRSELPNKSPEEAMVDLLPLHPDGPAPSEVPLPETPLYGTDNLTINAVRRLVKHSCRETTPGPDQWTQELLLAALGDALFAESFRNFLIDMCNGHLCATTEDLLRLSNLMGLAKDTGGTRPISMGETFLKLGEAIAIERENGNLQALFDRSQYGVGHRNGAETIVQHVRNFVRIGKRAFSNAIAGDLRVLATLDCKNAFNTPSREAILQAILKSKLAGLLGIFKTSYGNSSKMFVVGSKATLIVESKSGCRQGTTGGSVFFSITIQPALDLIRDHHEGTDALAYLDDITTQIFFPLRIPSFSCRFLLIPADSCRFRNFTELKGIERN